MTAKTFPPPVRRYVPENIDSGSWDSLKPLFDELEKRRLASSRDLETWLLDSSELEACLSAEEARRYIDMTCDTESESKKELYLEFSREILPRIKARFNRLDRLYLASPYREELPKERYGVFDRIKASDTESFSEANIEVETEEDEVCTRYTAIQGALTVEIDGEELPFARAALALEEQDRERREAVWRKMVNRRLEDRDEIETAFQTLLGLRRQQAKNAGYANYRDYRFVRLRRFDYGVEECEDFHRGVADVIVPRVRELNAERQAALSVPSLRPWDLDIDPLAAQPFRPFKTEEDLCDLTGRLFSGVEPELAAEFRALRDEGLLDLLARANKAPGGYQYFLEDVRLPFIFANAAGTHDDVQTLLHEGGHAFHSLACRDEPLIIYREPPMEFCEVASMGMEFLGLEHVGEVYPASEARRVRRVHLERTLRLFPWIATVDAFQHWIYSQDDDSVEGRRRKWLELSETFENGVDWSGLESVREVQWHKQGHVFRQPFYYIEYGIALIGALQIWSQAKGDPEKTLNNYRAALAHGGARSLKDLFEAAGLGFETGADILRPLVDAVFAEWKKLLEEEKAGVSES